MDVDSCPKNSYHKARSQRHRVMAIAGYLVGLLVDMISGYYPTSADLLLLAMTSSKR